MFKLVFLVTITLLNFVAKCDIKVNLTKVNTFIFSKDEISGQYDNAIYWGNDVEMNNYCEMYYGI